MTMVDSLIIIASCGQEVGLYSNLNDQMKDFE